MDSEAGSGAGSAGAGAAASPSVHRASGGHRGGGGSGLDSDSDSGSNDDANSELGSVQAVNFDASGSGEEGGSTGGGDARGAAGHTPGSAREKVTAMLSAFSGRMAAVGGGMTGALRRLSISESAGVPEGAVRRSGRLGAKKNKPAV